MAVGAGGLIGGLMFPGLDERLAQHITPNPNPLAQQGQPPGPKDVDSLGNPVPTQPQQPPLAPAAVTQPDPVNASYAADLLKAVRRDEMSQGINLGLDRIAAGFGTAQQQASKQQGIAHGQGVGGALGDLAGIQKMQDQTIQDNEHARFMGSAKTFAETLSRSLGHPVSVEEATTIMNSPDMMKAFGGAAGQNEQLTGTTKDADQATESYKIAHPNATPQEIADFRASVISMASGGGTIEDQQYRAYAIAERAAGRNPLDVLEWKASHAADAAGKLKEAKDVQDFKDSAVTDYQGIHTTVEKNKKTVSQLLTDIPSLMAALRDPGWATGTWSPLVSDKVKEMVPLISQLKAELAGEGLKNVKNVRNQREFDALAASLSAALDGRNSPEKVRGALEDIQKKFLDVQATSELAVGHKLTGELVGHGQRDLLKPKLDNGKDNPWYNGGSEETPEERADREKQSGSASSGSASSGSASSGSGDSASDEKPPVPNARKAKDGHWYVPDPDRPGKYQRVD